jgi:hypothetical protein
MFPEHFGKRGNRFRQSDRAAPHLNPVDLDGDVFEDGGGTVGHGGSEAEIAARCNRAGPIVVCEPMDEEARRLRRVVALAARHRTSLVTALRQHKGMPEAELASRSGMPVARFQGEAAGRITFTEDELDRIAAALAVEVDLLMDSTADALTAHERLHPNLSTPARWLC